MDHTTILHGAPLISQAPYIIQRGNIRQIQPVPQPNFLQVRSIAQSNGIPGIASQAQSYSAINNATVLGSAESPLVKFIKQLMELSQKTTPVGTQSVLINLVQKLIDDEIDCEVFCTQLRVILKSVHKRADLESLLKNNIAQLRVDLASGVCSIPQIIPPSRSPLPISSTTVFVNTPTVLNSVSLASQSLHRPSDGLPVNATFQLTQTGVGNLTSTFPRPSTALVQSSIFTPRSLTTAIAPAPTQSIRSLLNPTQPHPIRMKLPVNPVTFQQTPNITTIAPQRGPLVTCATMIRSIYPPVSAPSIISPVATVSALTTTAIPANGSPQNQINQPFFPVPQIRSYLASTFPPSSAAMFSDESVNCLVHGLDAFLRDVLSRLSVVVRHKAVKLSEDPHLTQVDYAREQLNYLQRLGEHDRHKQSELEKEYILKAAKSRTRSENPDQARYREMAHQLRNEQYERERQQQANKTALNAIGLPPNRRPRPPNTAGCDNVSSGIGGDSTVLQNLSLVNSTSRLRLVQQSSFGESPVSTTTATSLLDAQKPTVPRFTLAEALRTRRASLRDLQVVLDKDPRLCRSRALFRSHWR